MSRFSSVTGSLVFLLLAPGVVAGLIPWWISSWRMQQPFLGLWLFRVLGVLLLAGGTAVLLDSFARFALQGRGTPAPVLPTVHLVITGWYRYVRNPMYVAVTSLVLGQAFLLGDLPLLRYAALVWLGFHLFVLAYEEPTMRRSFGAEYGRFYANVPRWIPRLTAWKISRG
jgi:protein-S-isoprenylcysteine O-methyltransferase Ste14